MSVLAAGLVAMRGVLSLLHAASFCFLSFLDSGHGPGLSHEPVVHMTCLCGCARHLAANQHGAGGKTKKQSKADEASTSLKDTVWQAMESPNPGGYGVAMHALRENHGAAGVACEARIKALSHPHRVLQHASLVHTREALQEGGPVPRGWGFRTTNSVEAINACSVQYRRVHTMVVLEEGIARTSAYLIKNQRRADKAAGYLQADPAQWLNKKAAARWCQVKVVVRTLNVHFVGDGIYMVVVGHNSVSTGVKVDTNLKSCGCGV